MAGKPTELQLLSLQPFIRSIHVMIELFGSQLLGALLWVSPCRGRGGAMLQTQLVPQSDAPAIYLPIYGLNSRLPALPCFVP